MSEPRHHRGSLEAHGNVFADDVKGHDTTMGYSSRAGQPSSADAMVLELIVRESI